MGEEGVCVCVCFHAFNLCSASLEPHFSLADPTSCQCLGYFSVFTRPCKNSGVYNHLQCLPPASHLLEILGLSELTVTAHLPQTTLAHKQWGEEKKKREQQQGEKQVYDNILPPANPLASGQCCPGPNHVVMTLQHEAVCCLCLVLLTCPLWLCDQKNLGNRQLLLRATHL